MARRELHTARRYFQTTRRERPTTRREFQTTRREFPMTRREFQTTRRELQTITGSLPGDPWAPRNRQKSQKYLEKDGIENQWENRKPKMYA